MVVGLSAFDGGVSVAPTLEQERLRLRTRSDGSSGVVGIVRTGVGRWDFRVAAPMVKVIGP